MRVLWHCARWAGILISLFGAVGILSGLREMFRSLQGEETFLWLFMLGLGGTLAVAGIALERKMARRLQKDALSRAFSRFDSPPPQETETK